ncbi:tRNA 2-thiouridine(34) synthase MnmA [Candidatus Gracilibacteria bacterium]|nr:tRNA 2-thiouridine(34) synthase MnmA [Candidatus Gracilibacteria bacterium]
MKIAVLLSGGVDSSLALKLLKDQGHELHAFYLKIWLEDELQFLGECPWEDDLKYARQICADLDLPLEIVPMQRQYFDTVVDYTIKEVRAGRTPNPDIMCNSMIKFGLFMDQIDESFDKIASGHYAQTFQQDGITYLKKSPDALKDQTYFLARLTQKQLQRIIFPIGHLTKTEVRDLAALHNLPNQNRKDSQGICFLGKFRYDDFLRAHLGTKKGDLINFDTNEKVGTHDGFYYYTIGQRKGIGLSGGPWYVVAKDCAKNQVFISSTYHEQKPRDTVNLANFHWFSGQKPPQQSLQVKLRHGEQLHNCTFTDDHTIKLAENDQGIAPGQFAVFYDQELCLGSAVIA